MFLSQSQEENRRPYYLPLHEPENSTMVSIHPYLTLLGILSSVTIFIFCLSLVLIPLTSDYQGNLTYISNGMEKHCGWSGTVLGSCSIFVALCEATAALHTMNHSLLVAVFLQACSWCMVMGVSDTGWSFHYVALVVFLL